MKLYSISYIILGYAFNIITYSEKLLTSQIQHISKFCYSKPTNITAASNEIFLTYIEDIKTFYTLRNMFFSNDCDIINTFEHEQHYKINIKNRLYFMQLPDKYIIEKVSQTNYVVYGTPQHETTKYLFRIIREILVRLQENNGKLFMHGTAFNLENKGIALFGNAGSGKTTLFSKIIQNGKSNILSNDRIFIYKNQQAMMDYFPIPVVYKIGSVLHNEFLNKYVLKEKHYELPENFLNGRSSFPIPLTDMSRIFTNIGYTESSNLNLIIFPKINFEDANILKITQLNINQTINLMHTVCFTPHDTESLRKPWIFERNFEVKKLEADAHELIVKLSSLCPAFYVEFGKDIQAKTLYTELANLI